MQIFVDHILSWILFFPVIGAVVLLLVPAKSEKALRITAMIASWYLLV